MSCTPRVIDCEPPSLVARSGNISQQGSPSQHLSQVSAPSDLYSGRSRNISQTSAPRILTASPAQDNTIGPPKYQSTPKPAQNNTIGPPRFQSTPKTALNNTIGPPKFQSTPNPPGLAVLAGTTSRNSRSRSPQTINNRTVNVPHPAMGATYNAGRRGSPKLGATYNAGCAGSPKLGGTYNVGHRGSPNLGGTYNVGHHGSGGQHGGTYNIEPPGQAPNHGSGNFVIPARTGQFILNADDGERVTGTFDVSQLVGAYTVDGEYASQAVTPSSHGSQGVAHCGGTTVNDPLKSSRPTTQPSTTFESVQSPKDIMMRHLSEDLRNLDEFETTNFQLNLASFQSNRSRYAIMHSDAPQTV